MSLIRTVVVAGTAACVLAAGARADGLPTVLGADLGPTGIARPGGQFRYVTVPVRRDTLLAAIGRKSDAVEQRRLLAGRWTIPVVAYDGSVAGLSAGTDGRSYWSSRVCAFRAEAPRLRSCRRRSRARRSPCAATSASMRSRRTDASSISSSTSTGGLHPLRRSPLRRRGGPAAAGPIFDPGASKGPMRGSPVARAEGADGRWAYTLYDGAGGTPFVHALDTVGARPDASSSRASPRPRAATSPASASTSAARRSSSRTAARRSSWPARARSQCETRARQPRLPASTKTAGHGGSRSWRQAASSPLSAHRRPDAGLGGAERVLERGLGRRPPQPLECSLAYARKSKSSSEIPCWTTPHIASRKSDMKRMSRSARAPSSRTSPKYALRSASFSSSLPARG